MNQIEKKQEIFNLVKKYYKDYHENLNEYKKGG